LNGATFNDLEWPHPRFQGRAIIPRLRLPDDTRYKGDCYCAAFLYWYSMSKSYNNLTKSYKHNILAIAIFRAVTSYEQYVRSFLSSVTQKCCNRFMNRYYNENHAVLQTKHKLPTTTVCEGSSVLCSVRWRLVTVMCCCILLRLLHQGNDATLNFCLTNFTDVPALTTAIRNIQYLGGNTNTTGGLRLMRLEVFNRECGDRSDVPNVAILITDGIPTREVDRLPGEVAAIKSLDIRIVGVGVTNQVNSYSLYLSCRLAD